MKGLIVVMLGALAIGCSSSSGGGGTGASGVASGKRLDSLTDAEKGTLCDWEAAKFGGYGMVMDCGGGVTLTADASQAECVADWFTTCTATVGQAEACANAASCSNISPASAAFCSTAAASKAHLRAPERRIAGPWRSPADTAKPCLAVVDELRGYSRGCRFIAPFWCWA